MLPLREVLHLKLVGYTHGETKFGRGFCLVFPNIVWRTYLACSVAMVLPVQLLYASIRSSVMLFMISICIVCILVISSQIVFMFPHWKSSLKMILSDGLGGCCAMAGMMLNEFAKYFEQK